MAELSIRDKDRVVRKAWNNDCVSKSLLILVVKEESVSSEMLNCMEWRVTLKRRGESQKPRLRTVKAEGTLRRSGDSDRRLFSF